ncbi:WXG100 family type VII secretion target [Streptomyces sp. WAC06614]|uniref:WXG100 family type VII secretion target n=1 Tax=Streptomyces sp. WAC06614 TaxID=2487416 RepID=UPI000F77C2BB|nr:hypothetical protein [Streptomyces sp. WAC06614]RSS54759.1 hypothetical protein EF918_34645 [Streptomyces sp. WAC06614]
MAIDIKFDQLRLAIDEMEQLTRTMDNSLQGLLEGLAPMESTFTGAAAQAYKEFREAASNADAAMTALFGNGATKVASISELYKNTDLRGAATFQG